MAKRDYPLSDVYRLLEPGPVVLINTALKGRPNLMALSWLTMMEFTPPLVGVILSNRNHSFEALRSTRECAINLPTEKIARKAVRCGNISGRFKDKFAAVGLTTLPASRIKPPLISECFANLECKVIDSRLEGRYNFFVLKVVKAWIDRGVKQPRTFHHHGRGLFTIDGKRIRLPSRVP